jgi:hypothetical protein
MCRVVLFGLTTTSPPSRRKADATTARAEQKVSWQILPNCSCKPHKGTYLTLTTLPQSNTTPCPLHVSHIEHR